MMLWKPFCTCSPSAAGPTTPRLRLNRSRVAAVSCTRPAVAISTPAYGRSSVGGGLTCVSRGVKMLWLISRLSRVVPSPQMLRPREAAGPTTSCPLVQPTRRPLV